jgi:hypothetical protein
MNVIQPFRRRIIIEALIKTLLICLLIFGVAMVGVAATYIILHESLVIIIGTVLSGLLSIIISIPIFLRSKAKKLRQLNYRLDALGLDERVSTMAEFRHDKSYVAQM